MVRIATSLNHSMEGKLGKKSCNVKTTKAQRELAFGKANSWVNHV